jgi:hypothetical protein
MKFQKKLSFQKITTEWVLFCYSSHTITKDTEELHSRTYHKNKKNQSLSGPHCSGGTRIAAATACSKSMQSELCLGREKDNPPRDKMRHLLIFDRD